MSAKTLLMSDSIRYSI